MANQTTRVFVAGHRGMVGAAIVRALQAQDHVDIVTRTHAELDLANQQQVRSFFSGAGVDQVYLAAARVGGIHANDTYPAEFIHQNLMIAANVIDEAWRHGVQELLFLGSSCIYPRLAPQPIRESDLMTGALEPTNAPYAIAKIAGIAMCESYNRQYGTDFRSVMPTNLYGPGDNYHATNSHVIPGLIRRFHEARKSAASVVKVWGSGKPLREFLHADDLATACLHVMAMPRVAFDAVAPASFVNVGSGEEVTIADLARLIADVTGYRGDIAFDASQPDGTPRKRLHTGALEATGWHAATTLRDGLAATYAGVLAQGLLEGDTQRIGEPAP
jgi:GDP-L-fucose synthase